MFQEYLNLNGCLREVSKVFQGSFKEVLRVFQVREGCSESPLRVTQGSFKASERSSKGVSRQFEDVFRKIQGV